MNADDEAFLERVASFYDADTILDILDVSSDKLVVLLREYILEKSHLFADVEVHRGGSYD